jgi:hypothetical protein
LVGRLSGLVRSGAHQFLPLFGWDLHPRAHVATARTDETGAGDPSCRACDPSRTGEQDVMVGLEVPRAARFDVVAGDA